MTDGWRRLARCFLWDEVNRLEELSAIDRLEGLSAIEIPETLDGVLGGLGLLLGAGPLKALAHRAKRANIKQERDR